MKDKFLKTGQTKTISLLCLGIFLILMINASFKVTANFVMVKAAWKKVDKVISSIWENQEITKQKIDLSSIENIQETGKELFYILTNNKNDTVAYMVIGSTPSRYDVFELMILFDKNKKIIKTNVLTYREGYGGEIMSSRWLNQFIGMTYSDPIKLDKDIQGISGATISVRSATFEIRRLTNMIEQLDI